MAETTYDPEFVSYEHIMFTEVEEYNASALKYERNADLRLRDTNIVVLSGWGLKICVRDGSLSIEYQRGDNSRKTLLLNRGVHKVRNIVVTSKGGFVTIDAIFWLQQQGISLYLIDWKGEISQTLSPMQNRSARLAYLQYRAIETGLDIEIARQLVAFKAKKQLVFLKNLPDHWYVEAPDRIFIKDGCRVIFRGNNKVDYGEPVWQMYESATDRLSGLDSVDLIRLAEASYAAEYWQLVANIPIHWKTSDEKHIPNHWHSISTRLSSISRHDNASNATNPFHTTLNFAYALLECQVLEAINIIGLSPEVGFLHTKEGGGNLLAYDIMELFRSDVDAMVLRLFQTTTFTKGDFIQWYTGECRLNDQLRRYVLAECRIEDKAVDLQCRWLRSLLEGQS